MKAGEFDSRAKSTIKELLTLSANNKKVLSHSNLWVIGATILLAAAGVLWEVAEEIGQYAEREDRILSDSGRRLQAAYQAVLEKAGTQEQNGGGPRSDELAELRSTIKSLKKEVKALKRLQ